MSDDIPLPLQSLTRKKERGGDTALLYEIIAQQPLAVLSCCLDGHPWTVPLFVSRYESTLLFHASSGAGAARYVADGAVAVLTFTIVDGMVMTPELINHSATYRSAIVRGHCHSYTGEEKKIYLERYIDAIYPGRSGECAEMTEKHLAKTLILGLDITENNWITKQRQWTPKPVDNGWNALVPVHQHYGDPVHQGQPCEVPESLTTFIHQHNQSCPSD